MWSRKELKERAKAILAVNYWNAFLISIIIALVGGNNLLSGGNHHFNNSRHSIFLIFIITALFIGKSCHFLYLQF